MALYVLYEHAAGYAVFSVKEFEEIAMLLPQVEQSVTDLSRFNSIVKLLGFSPFKTAVAALENVNAISEGIVPDDLSVFLDSVLPKASKSNKFTLGVADAKLGAALGEALKIQCSHIGAVPEILRGIRHHFPKLVKGFSDKSAGVAQLGLGHSYSRCKVKFNVHRSDNMIIQSIALLDQLDKDINTFSMRIREWYSYHFPELVKIVPDNYLFAKVAHFVKDRKSLSAESLEALEEIVMDSEKAQAIIDASKMSMGMDISVIDLLNIEMFAKRVVHLSEYRHQLAAYLHSKMGNVAPNLQSLIGDQVGARLISKAGSLTNLAKYPASTVQILGAEKALFRALKTKSNTPKYGLLFNSSFIGRANAKNKGRISRFLANKRFNLMEIGRSFSEMNDDDNFVISECNNSCPNPSSLNTSSSINNSSSNILLNLGFGPAPHSTDVLSKIPKRFLKPSQVRGVDTEAFLRQQQLSMHIHENSVLGYRGLVGNPHIPPSMIVAKIMERFQENERGRLVRGSVPGPIDLQQSAAMSGHHHPSSRESSGPPSPIPIPRHSSLASEGRIKF